MIYFLTENDLNSSSAVLRIQGPDANTYLQGQITQDIRVGDFEVVYGLWLDQKGRALADSYVRREAENHFLVISFSVTAQVLRERVEKYLIADEVEIEDLTEAWAGILIWGDAVDALLPPAGVHAFPSRRAGRGSRQWMVPKPALAAVRTAIAGQESDFATAELARIRSLLPRVPVDIGPRDLPNEGGLDHDAISYTKGCYLGQEVMARLKNLGQVRRRLHLVEGRGEAPPAGTPLFQGDRRVGDIRSSAEDGDRFAALAMLSLVNLDPGAGLSFGPDSAATLVIKQHV